MKKKHTKNEGIIESKGFYIALCSCIAVLGIIAYVGNSIGKDKAEDLYEASDNVVVEENSLTPYPVYTVKPSYAPAVKSTPIPTKKPTQKPTPIPTKKPTQKSSAAVSAKSAQTIPPEPPKAVNFVMPVDGKIISTYSENLTYNKTMADWRTHNGIDIQAEKNAPVKAAYDGIVEEIGENTKGVFIILSHSNDYKTVYANLADEIKLKKGDSVKTGDIIASVGDTTIEEKLSEPHLHFEILKGEETVNPADLLKSN